MTDPVIWAGVAAKLGWTGRATVNLAETLAVRHAAAGSALRSAGAPRPAERPSP